MGKLVKELQKLTVHSAIPPEKLTRETNFARWESRCKDYLQGLDARAHSGAILALLDDEVYDLALSADLLAATAPSAVLDGLREILGSFEHPWRAFPTLDAKALSTRVLEQLVAGIRDPQIRKILLRDWPPTLEKALALAREEEVLQAVCEQPSRSLFSVTAVQPHSSRDASSQSPRQSCSCGSSPRRRNWRRPQTRRPQRPQARRTIDAIDAGPEPIDGEYYIVPDTNLEGQVARWQEKLAEYEFECVFRLGRQHGNADALSRKQHRPHGECPSCTDVTIFAVALQSDQCLLLAAAQRDDPHTFPIYNRKVSNARPLSKSELAGYSYETRCLHSLKDKLFIENGVLFYRDSEQYPKRVVLPLSMVDDVVERMHAELGHYGIHKTEWALRRRYFWPNQKRDIQDVIR
ncbi:unnamed protein product, partial [Schistocephalus solidus]